MHVYPVDPQTYEAAAAEIQPNFLQTLNMRKVQEARGVPGELLLFEDYSGEIVGMANLSFVRVHKIFRLAQVVGGPCFKPGSDLVVVSRALAALDQYCQDHHNVAALFFQMDAPYAITEHGKEEEVVGEDLLTCIRSLGFEHHGFEVDLDNINTVYVKNVAQYPTFADVRDSYKGRLRRQLERYEQMNVEVEEQKDPDRFYEIIEDTANRKGFEIPERAYFKRLKDAFGDDCIFMTATLYPDRAAQGIAEAIAEIEHIQATEKLSKVKKDDYRQRLESWERAKGDLDALDPDRERFDVASMVFLRSANELVAVFGGRDPDLSAFGGLAILNDAGIRLAREMDLERYNFYGAFELGQNKRGSGNLHFKTNFHGALVKEIGRFEKQYSKLYGFLKKLKR